MLTRLTNRLENTLYIFSQHRKAPAKYLALYQSAVFKSENFDDVFKDSESALRYKLLLPTLLTSQTGFYPSRFLYTSLGFDPENEVLRVVTLRAAGFHFQQFSINNVIPWSYRDMCAQSKFPEPKHPIFLDDEMIYFNVCTKETIFGERDGIWNEEVANHPLLSVATRFNQKEWLDRQMLF